MSTSTSWIKQYFSCRRRLCYACATGFLLMQAMRVDLSMAFVCMLKTPNRTTEEVNVTANNQHCSGLSNHSINRDFEGELEWSDTLQANMLAGYFYGGITLSFVSGGVLVNNSDIAPRFAGIVYGIANTFASTSGSINSLTTKALTPNGTQEEWQIVFALSAVICVAGAILFAILRPNRTTEELNITSTNQHCSGSNSYSVIRNYEGEFEWSDTLQATMLAGYFYGSIATTYLGGLLADKYGGK
ncbi:Hypothetical predicted protein [Octopus vulgaris]|uniref:Major facilitator superfamily (MFS) profile domain-containing protein n=1 Tax=Octopus vulgaris TaxID=6645 RepID=A0AA36BT92_OCTVU|nr:Hypothetical predicted protein [Octopus vulgaris]